MIDDYKTYKTMRLFLAFLFLIINTSLSAQNERISVRVGSYMTDYSFFDYPRITPAVSIEVRTDFDRGSILNMISYRQFGTNLKIGNLFYDQFGHYVMYNLGGKNNLFKSLSIEYGAFFGFAAKSSTRTNIPLSENELIDFSDFYNPQLINNVGVWGGLSYQFIERHSLNLTYERGLNNIYGGATGRSEIVNIPSSLFKINTQSLGITYSYQIK